MRTLPGNDRNHKSSYSSLLRMTGIRSWTAEVTALGVVVKIEHDLIHCPPGSVHRYHNPAKANSSLSLTLSVRRAITEQILTGSLLFAIKNKGYFACFFRLHTMVTGSRLLQKRIGPRCSNVFTVPASLAYAIAEAALGRHIPTISHEPHELHHRSCFGNFRLRM